MAWEFYKLLRAKIHKDDLWFSLLMSLVTGDDSGHHLQNLTKNSKMKIIKNCSMDYLELESFFNEK